MSILVTGGTGFIGSHSCLLLLKRGFKLYIIDSEVNSSKNVLKNISSILKLSNKDFSEKINFFKGDLRSISFIKKVFKSAINKKEPIEAVFHFAGLKSVYDSNKYPFEYWDNNFVGTLNLLKIMEVNNCKTLIFSSSATIYKSVNKEKIKENYSIGPINTYGETKSTIEKLLQAAFKSQPNKWKIANLRYFNPIGAHSSGQIGEDPKGVPNNIFPIILKVAKREKKFLKIFGNDWNTVDGTCVRDYIHIMDLAEGHIAAFEFLTKNNSQIVSFNLGTGRGHSVLELINTFKKVNNVDIPYEFASRREGDNEFVVADNSLAVSILDWEPKYSLVDMCKDGWNWGKNKK
tara:strand:+ start:169 stop:1209 length:1041 start_codon:yes stop_codon:yes gene_type:complete